MVTILMMSVKIATLGPLKFKIPLTKGILKNTFDVTNNIL